MNGNYQWRPSMAAVNAERKGGRSMEEREIVQRIADNINRVFVGKEGTVHDLLVCLLAGGHVLLEDVPGVGKTTLARLLACSIGCSFGRIQFTPDTLPGDVMGVSVYNMKSGEFEFRPGAVMNQVLLADEINRTSPRTQASLLEAMSEGQVTVDADTHVLPRPFLVIATQNPVEYIGTYPLPEAQMDRFMMRLAVGYPDRVQEVRMASQFLEGVTPSRAERVCGPEEVLSLQGRTAQVQVKDLVLEYMEDIVDLTRNERRFALGASPRALLALVRASQAHAFMEGRDFVKPDDVKGVAAQVLLHRMVLTPEARLAGENPAVVLKSLLLKAKVPVFHG